MAVLVHPFSGAKKIILAVCCRQDETYHISPTRSGAPWLRGELSQGLGGHSKLRTH